MFHFAFLAAVLTAPAALAETEGPAADAVVQKLPVQRAASVRLRVTPRYPDFALDQGIEGTCRLQVDVSAEGRVQDVHVGRCAKVFHASAEQAVSRWLWTPAKVDGQPVPSVQGVVLDYTIVR